MRRQICPFSEKRIDLRFIVCYFIFSAPSEGCDVSRVELPPDKVLATSSVTAYGSWK